MHRDLRAKLLLSITSKLNNFTRVSIKRLMLLRIIIIIFGSFAHLLRRKSKNRWVSFTTPVFVIFIKLVVLMHAGLYSQSWQILIKLVVIATDCDSGLMTSGSSGPILLLRLLVINCEVDLHDLWEDVWEVTGLDSVGFPKRKLTRGKSFMSVVVPENKLLIK